MAKIRKIYDETIKPNGRPQAIYPITSTQAVYNAEGITLQTLLNEGYRFGGVIQLDSSPLVNTKRIMYLTSGPGTYINFGGIEVENHEVAAIVTSNGSTFEKKVFAYAYRQEEIQNYATKEYVNNEITEVKQLILPDLYVVHYRDSYESVLAAYEAGKNLVLEVYGQSFVFARKYTDDSTDTEVFTFSYWDVDAEYIVTNVCKLSGWSVRIQVPETYAANEIGTRQHARELPKGCATLNEIDSLFSGDDPSGSSS